MIDRIYVKILAIAFALVIVCSYVTITNMRATIKELSIKPSDTVFIDTTGKIFEEVKRDTVLINKKIYITKKIYEKKVDSIRHEPDSAIYARFARNLAKRFDSTSNDLHK